MRQTRPLPNVCKMKTRSPCTPENTKHPHLLNSECQIVSSFFTRCTIRLALVCLLYKYYLLRYPSIDLLLFLIAPTLNDYPQVTQTESKSYKPTWHLLLRYPKVPHGLVLLCCNDEQTQLVQFHMCLS